MEEKKVYYLNLEVDIEGGFKDTCWRYVFYAFRVEELIWVGFLYLFLGIRLFIVFYGASGCGIVVFSFSFG